MVEVALLVHGGYGHLQYVHPGEGISESHPYNKVSKAEGKEPARILKRILPTSSSVTSEVKGNGNPQTSTKQEDYCIGQQKWTKRGRHANNVLKTEFEERELVDVNSVVLTCGFLVSSLITRKNIQNCLIHWTHQTKDTDNNVNV